MHHGGAGGGGGGVPGIRLLNGRPVVESDWLSVYTARQETITMSVPFNARGGVLQTNSERSEAILRFH